MITPDDIAALMNEFVAADPAAAHALCEARVPCGPGVEAHPTLTPYADTPGGPPSIGLIGVLNGLARRAGMLVVAEYGDTDAGPTRLRGFTVRPLEA